MFIASEFANVDSVEPAESGNCLRSHLQSIFSSTSHGGCAALRL